MDKIFNKFQDVLDIEIDLENFSSHHDIEIGPWQTADGYDVWVMTEDPRHINWEREVYYNEPTFSDVVDYIKDGSGSLQTVLFPEFWDIFDHYTMLEVIEDNWNDEDESYNDWFEREGESEL